MANINVQVTVAQSSYDLMSKLANLVSTVKAAGGFTAAALPAEIAALVADLQPIINDVGSLPADFAADKVAFLTGASIGAELVVEAALGLAP